MSTSMKRNIRPNKKSCLSKIINYITEIWKMEGNGQVSENTRGTEIQSD